MRETVGLILMIVASGCGGAIVPSSMDLVPDPSAERESTLHATTGTPRVDTSSGTPLRLLVRSAYDLEVSGQSYFVGADKDPWHADPAARYATFGQHGSRATLVVRPSDDGGASFLVDRDRDGDLRFEQVLITSEAEFGQQVQLMLETPDVLVGLAYAQVAGQPPTVFLMSTTLRHGTLRLGEQSIGFSVEGDSGTYGREYQAVYFDTNGDGAVDDTFLSDERYTPASGYVNLAGRSYGFSVSEDGGRLSLEPLDELQPDRAPLAAGNPAPEFEFVDIDGETGRLSDYRGRVVLLYVWGTWCGPCEWETPKLVEAYREFNADGFEILAVAKNDRYTAVREYVEVNEVDWRQVLDAEDGPIVTLYRADGVPSMLLIDRDGTILEREIRGEALGERLAGLIAGESRP